jgi:peptidyl-prolyl cis-trans isomerase A (cyclophilin A)
MKITLQRVGSAVSIALLAVASLGAQAPAAKKSATAKAGTGAKAAASPYDKALLNPASLTAKAPDEFDVKFTTTKGDIVVHVTRSWSPNGADRFYNLVKHHFFDGTAFFRNVKGFMVQFGLSPYPEITTAWHNATIKDDPGGQQSNKPGYITFAKTGMPNSRTTQLFINHGNNAGLDPQGFTPFGVVTTGLDIVEQLYDGYGEAPDQGQISAKGKAYLSANFPKLDLITKAVIVGEPAPAAKSATGTKKSAGTGATKKQ